VPAVVALVAIPQALSVAGTQLATSIPVERLTALKVIHGLVVAAAARVLLGVTDLPLMVEMVELVSPILFKLARRKITVAAVAVALQADQRPALAGQVWVVQAQLVPDRLPQSTRVRAVAVAARCLLQMEAQARQASSSFALSPASAVLAQAQPAARSRRLWVMVRTECSIGITRWRRLLLAGRSR
jgi:uncharacterized membrane protein YhdT